MPDCGRIPPERIGARHGINGTRLDARFCYHVLSGGVVRVQTPPFLGSADGRGGRLPGPAPTCRRGRHSRRGADPHSTIGARTSAAIPPAVERRLSGPARRPAGRASVPCATQLSAQGRFPQRRGGRCGPTASPLGTRPARDAAARLRLRNRRRGWWTSRGASRDSHSAIGDRRGCALSHCGQRTGSRDGAPVE